MHIDPAMIHPELRRAASLIRLLWTRFTERKYRFAKKANQKLKGRCRSPLTYEQKTIVRPDGSLLRLCIYSAQNPKSHVPGPRSSTSWISSALSLRATAWRSPPITGFP